MTKYYVNQKEQNNGDHEVHTESCQWLPSLANRKYLGEFSDCKAAVKEAEKYFVQVNGCRTCSTICHTQ